ncbi:prepilin-type N-terminal cleavage/methylation domain-containing protein [Acinetobacter sp. ANC 5414]|uniref:prepilin-type N-terminal cleavage/methylation domain-containing protein n=1 Tax=Acinetobacter sp. ANC 5414 TaxID=2731251 RepID=UPI00148F9533|nr:prepilin-type N-terminal cleavage/methylation domain-containing protein [Acinetobacter sp. ANC 5414]NNH00379.1 prepilin-type N-terminal cleavage/methylation domain-containing protein [Acinetobacter sp. ANC 5414]
MVSQRGVTLIELMVAIALLAILALAIFPLGRVWVANQQITKTEKLFLEAYARTKNEALRNPNAVKGATKAASLEVTTTTVAVKDSNDVAIWSIDIAPTVTVTLSTACDQKVILNNNANITTTGCALYTITASGGTNATGAL